MKRRRPDAEERLDKEIRFHLDEHAAHLIARGHTPEDARRLARMALGGPEQVKEQCRDARPARWLEDLRQDVHYALRTLRKKPGFASVALLTLALGIGTTTVMFTVVNSVLLKPLAYPQPDRLLSLHELTEEYGDQSSFAYLNFLDCQRESRALGPMAAWHNAGGTISEPGDAEYVSGRQVSAGLFATLGIPVLRGRAFLPDEDRAGGTPVIIISRRLWQARFGGTSKAIGARLVLDGKPYSVVGVAPAGLPFFEQTDIFTPLGQNTTPMMQNREMHAGIHVLARLRPGVTLAQARTELALIGRHLAQEYPKSNGGHSIVASPLRQDVVRNVRPTLWLLLGAVSLVLLIACANVASLLLARAISRERELAMRVALGARRGRLIRQCLTEGLVLALCGGFSGVLMAAAGTRPFLVFWPGSLPRAGEVHLDGRVLLFSLAAALVSGLLFGLAPALRAPVRDLESVLRSGARTVAGHSRRLHSALVASEIALAVLLLAGAATLGRTLLRVALLSPGMDVHNVLISRLALSSSALASPAHRRVAWHQILTNLHQTPGVESAALADIIPMGGDDELIGYWTTPVAPPVNQMPLSLLNLVTPDYFRALHIPLLQGRYFTDHDDTGSELVVAIDEVMAKRAFHGRQAVGSRLWMQFVGPVRVVAVVGHVRHWGLDADDQAKVREQVYVPFLQLPDAFLRATPSVESLVVRTTLPPLGMVDAVKRQVRGATQDQTIYQIRTMEQVVSGTLARQRFLLLLFGIFSGLALLLACVGIYGVLAYLTSRRIPEIAVRMALGATARSVRWMVLRQSLAMILAGGGVGLCIAVATSRLFVHVLEGVQPADASTFALVLAVLVVAAMMASYVPARRASRVDPVSALRQE